MRPYVLMLSADLSADTAELRPAGSRNELQLGLSLFSGVWLLTCPTVAAVVSSLRACERSWCQQSAQRAPQDVGATHGRWPCCTPPPQVLLHAAASTPQ